MKKFILALLICFLCLPTALLYGCNNTTNSGINLSVYFENDVKYKVYDKTGTTTATLKDFTHNNHNDQVQYTNITFTGKPAWLYKMTLEKVTFDVYGSVDVDDLQITITITNLVKGDTSITTSNTLTKEIPVNVTKNKAVKVSLDVNDVFNSISASTTIKIDIDPSYYKGDNKDLGFKLDVMNFKVYGEHKK